MQSLIRWAARNDRPDGLEFVDSCARQDDRTIKVSLKQSLPIFIEAIGKGGASVPFVMPEHLAKTDPFKQVTQTHRLRTVQFRQGGIRSGLVGRL